MENNQGSRMKISWVLSDSASFDPEINLEQLKNIGPFWGSWQTWRGCATDNVICHEFNRAQNLLQRQFHKNCHFFIPNDLYAQLERPSGVKLYDGSFVNLDVEHKEEIIAMHLAASQSDIVLLKNFNCTEQPIHSDKLINHRTHNYKQLIKHAIQMNTMVQWVLVDHPADLMDELKDLTNLTQDTLENIISMLGS